MSKKYSVRFEKQARKALKKMDKPIAAMIMSWIKNNLEGCEDPYLNGKSLVENHKGKWRYRVGNYRIIAHIDDYELIILVLTTGHRKEIYK